MKELQTANVNAATFVMRIFNHRMVYKKVILVVNKATKLYTQKSTILSHYIIH